MTPDGAFPATRRLFDEQPACLSFEGTVLACERAEGGWDVILDRTAIFPEGGGQGADRGLLGGAKVLDAQEERGVIRHRCDAPLAPGETVKGAVDAARRLDMSQQHTGEHILSGTIHGLYGYNNVGFHIGADAVTVDVGGLLTEEDLRRAERLANECVWRDQPVEAWFPTEEELKGIAYRSKKTIDGGLRLVRIGGVDTCACCGTHVPSTGCVGQILIVSAIHYKGGMRLTILCGGRALAHAVRTMDENRAVSRALSAKAGELEEAVLRLLRERDELESAMTALALRRLEHVLEARRDETVRAADLEGLKPQGLPKAAGRLAEGARAGLALLPEQDGGWRFALCAKEGAGPAAKALCAAFGGRGGGSGEMAQGKLASGSPEAMRETLAAFFAG